MKTLTEWLERLIEARGMPEEIRERAWTISKLMMRIDGRKLGLDGLARERRTVEAARKARDEIAASGQSFGSLSAKELANISWEPFAEAAWNEAVNGLAGFEGAAAKAAKFQSLAKWLVPLLET